MPLNREAKGVVVSEVAAHIANAQTMVLADYRGITVADLTALRLKARTQQVHLRVLKNTLARRAVLHTSFSALAEQMNGPLIYAFSNDAIAAVRVIYDFSKINNKLVIRAGACQGSVIDCAAVQSLARIPDRPALLARLLAVMQFPVSSFARLLNCLAQKQHGSDF